MKKIAGIIAEYNPFHEGHAHQLQLTREKIQPDLIVVILTGCFSSRGLPSLMSVEDKTRLALQNGADLVLELPFAYGAQSADRFARHAIESLKACGITHLCFGSETADLQKLKELASQMETLQVDPSTSMARNTQNQLEKLQPNDILGVQYVRYALPSGILPVPVKRDQSLESATSLRTRFFDHQTVPRMKMYHPAQSWNTYYPLLQAALLFTDAGRLQEFFLVEEGIENRLKKAALESGFNSFLKAAVSKTYSKTRIQRTCLMILMQIEKQKMKENPSFDAVKLLGMNEKGRQYLGLLKEKEIPVYSKYSQLPPFLQELDLKSRQLYGLAEKEKQEWKIVYEPEPKENQ